MLPFKLHDGLLLGCATAATQIEGGDDNNSWYDWSLRDRIRDRSTSYRADDHWNRYKDDIDLMSDMGIRIYRMGLEWSRLEPEEGRFDTDVLEHYRDEISYLISKGIRPLVTLHHFTNPMWFERSGAFENEKNSMKFLAFVRFAVEGLGDLCSEWVTINEPNVYATNGYVYGEWPPAVKSFSRAMRVMRNMACCHLKAYRLIHEIRSEKGFSGRTMAGFANHVRIFVPLRKRNAVDRIASKVLEYLFQGAMSRSMMTGRLAFPIGFGRPCGRGVFSDYIGINYYTRSAIRGLASKTMPGTSVNDLGWEIYPEGLSILAKRFNARYQLPVWITENGTCDAKDAFRTQYIYDHIRRIADDPAVERFYHWTLMDNFEWLEGESARFGLVEVDFVTQKRTMRKSGRFYTEIIREHGVNDDMISRYF